MMVMVVIIIIIILIITTTTTATATTTTLKRAHKWPERNCVHKSRATCPVLCGTRGQLSS